MSIPLPGFDLVAFSGWLSFFVAVYFMGYAAGLKIAVIRRFVHSAT